MRIVFRVMGLDLSKAKDLIEKDPIGRSSIYYNTPMSLNLDGEGTFVIIDGSEENCKLAREALTDLGEEITGEELEAILQAFDKTEGEAMEGFGGIFS